MSDNIYGHNFHCPKCATHLTSLFLCGECGIRYDEWFAAWQENQRLKGLLAELCDLVMAHAEQMPTEVINLAIRAGQEGDE